MADPTDLQRQQLRERRLANALALENIRGERLATVTHRAKRRRQLTESALDWITPYSDMLDRFRPNGDPVIAGATNYWNRRYGKNWPVFQTEQELAILRAPARLMLATNDYAIGLVNGIAAYVIGVGYTYRPAKKRKESTLPPEVLQALQCIVDEILEANEWTGGELPGIEDECFWRSLEDGEFGIVEYPQPDGLTEFRIFEPEQLTQPPGSNYYDWLFGVCTDPDDVQKPLSYWLQWGDSPGDGEEYGPDRITHFKRNGRRGQKRGLTDFCFGHYDRMNLANNLLLNLGDTATQQASIPYVMEHETATQPEVQAMRDDMADFIEVESQSGNSVAVRKSRRGMGQDIPKGQRYVDGPGAPYSDKHLAILDACLRGAVARWNGFEWLISANAGNNNLPTDLSAESPFVRRVMKEQNRYTGAFKKPVWRAVEHYVRTRGLTALAREWTWDEIAKEVDLLVKAPSPQTRNRLEEAQIASIEIPMGAESRQNYMQTQGRDPDQIEADNQAWQDEHGNDGQQLEVPGGPAMLDSLGRKIHRKPATAATESLLEAKDAEGHEHKGKGKDGGQFTGDGDSGGSGGTKEKEKPKTKKTVPQAKMSEKALRAQASATRVDSKIQRYAEEHNEPRFAKAVGGLSFKDNEPVDVVLGKGGVISHGIELKTMVTNKANKITMKRSAMERKAEWEKANKATFHTVVIDDSAVFNAKGEGEHDESKRRIFYRRGFGSFRVNTMHEVKNIGELKKLLNTKNEHLPDAAKRKG